MSSSQNEAALCSIYNQYINTNVEKLVQGICDISKGYNEVTTQLLDEYFDLNKATKERLDNFGKLLNFNRYITFNDPLDVVLPTSPGIEEYQVLMQDLKKCRLDDDAYRKILKIILHTRNTVASVRTLSHIISDVINADVFVGDAMDMRYITYYFLDRIPAYLEVCIHNFDILPRPAGMATQYISAISRFLGFLIQSPAVDREATAKIISSFWKCRFPEATKGIVKIPLEKIIFPLPEYTPVNITAEQLQYAKSQVAESHENFTTAHKQIVNRESFYASNAGQDIETAHDRVKRYYGATFRLYTQAADQQDYNYANMLMYGAALNTVEAIDKHYKKDKYLYQKRQLSNYRDPREDLFFDRKTGWYFYKEPDENGNFIPEYIANIYQDGCGIWYPQEPLGEQIIFNRITLRHEDYYNNKLTKEVTSPFLEKYRELMDTSRFSLFKDIAFPELTDVSPQNSGLLQHRINTIIDRLHECVKKWHKANKINEPSFRAALDHEYRNANLIMYRNYLRRQYVSTPADTRQDLQYIKYIYESLNEYFGNNQGYYDSWIDSDTNAPVYKRKLFIKTQRYLVRQTIRELENAAGDQIVDINLINSSHSNVLDLLQRIQEMRKDLERDFYNEFETSSYKGAHNFEKFTQVNMVNDQLQNQYNWNVNEIEKFKKIKSAYSQAYYSCLDLKSKCDSGAGTTGQFYNSWYCSLKDNLTEVPDFNNRREWMGVSDGTATSRANNWYYCNGEAQRMANRQNSNISWAQTQIDNSTFWKESAYREQQVRGLVTKDRSLKDIIRVYNSYTPPLPIPEPDVLEKKHKWQEWTLPDDYKPKFVII